MKYTNCDKIVNYYTQQMNLLSVVKETFPVQYFIENMDLC